MIRLLVALATLLIGILGVSGTVAPAAAHGVRVGIAVPAPVVVAPAPVFVAPAPVVVAPPVVFAPGVPVYFYGSRYYSFHRGGWYVTPGYGRAWAPIGVGHVPRSIVVAPGFHARGFHGRWHGHR